MGGKREYAKFTMQPSPDQIICSMNRLSFAELNFFQLSPTVSRRRSPGYGIGTMFQPDHVSIAELNENK